MKISHVKSLYIMFFRYLRNIFSSRKRFSLNVFAVRCCFVFISKTYVSVRAFLKSLDLQKIRHYSYTRMSRAN